jgi:hypothetical protein
MTVDTVAKATRYNVQAMGQYDVAQVCTNGHVTNDRTRSMPEFSQKFCKRCGAKTIDCCPACKAPIRGYYHVEGVVSVSARGPKAPPFCIECGAAYPWTEERLVAARQLVEEMELDVPEKTLVLEDVDNIVRDTPKASASAVRFERYLERAKPILRQGFKTILTEVLSESAKKVLGW